MKIEKVKEFLKAVGTDPEAQKVLQQLDRSADVEGIIRYCAEAAKRLGFDLTEEEIREGFQAVETERRKKTADASGEIEDLSDDEIENAAGGVLWDGEDAPDGHEMGCFWTYHGYDWQEENGIWCRLEYWCNANNMKGQDLCPTVITAPEIH